jgi:hypothetical protein
MLPSPSGCHFKLRKRLSERDLECGMIGFSGCIWLRIGDRWWALVNMVMNLRVT